MTRAYESTNGRYIDVNDTAGRDRKRTKRCDECRVALERNAGWLWCPSCGKTADEMAQVPQ